MADRIIKGDSGNDVVIQNNGGTRKIEVTNSGDVEVTGDFKATTVKATNLKANDGTAGLVIADSTGQVTSSGKINLNGNELILDADADSSITADSDDQIDFRAGGSDSVKIGNEHLTINDGNLVIGTAGHGITFGGDPDTRQNSPTVGDRTLYDYEEGTWTPSVTEGSGSITIGAVSGNYVKIGKKVTANLSIVISSATSATINTINGFPFTCENLNARGVGVLRENGQTGNIFQLRSDKNTTSFMARRYDNNDDVATNYEFVGSVTYFTP